jgi:hypothetical protein
MDTFSPQIYGNYLGLDAVMLHYLDIEEIVQRHQVNPAPFETQEALYFLAQRFDLPSSRTFPAFLDRYDAKYATVRSYLLPGIKPKVIILKAAEAGNLQAFYLGLRRNPKYKNPFFLNQALKRAARGDHQVMIDLIKDLGGTSFNEEVCGMAQGGHLEKLKRLIFQGPDLSSYLLFPLTRDAARYGHLATVKYLTTLWTPDPFAWKHFAGAAGKSGNQAMVDYIISQGGNNYTEVILGAITGGRLELAMRYMDKPGLDYLHIFSQAIRHNYLDLAKRAASYYRIDRATLNDIMSDVSESQTFETIDYLISLGGNNYRGLVNRLAKNGQLELFKRYYLSPDVDYARVFNKGLVYSSVEIVKFMLEQRLVPVTEKKLNKYLKMDELNPEIIALLFSLGATDYGIIVVRGLIQGDLELAKKYFDQAPTIRLNSVFKRCTSVPVYQYLLSRGKITQKTVDATLKRLSRHKHKYVEVKQYLSSLSLHDLACPPPD